MSEMARKAGWAARAAVHGLSLSGQMMTGDDPARVRCDLVAPTGTIVFSGTARECHAHMDLLAGRAAIAALREPSGSMKTAGMRNMVSWQVAQTGKGEASQAQAALVWDAMIDAALK